MAAFFFKSSIKRARPSIENRKKRPAAEAVPQGKGTQYESLSKPPKAFCFLPALESARRVCVSDLFRIGAVSAPARDAASAHVRPAYAISDEQANARDGASVHKGTEEQKALSFLFQFAHRVVK